jgi:murein DD-endopeptidase MepM/ murein hydrolase activator NlpD
MSEFGDRRSYSFEGRIIDRQTHLGIDLASLKRADVGAAQDGIVVFAGDLGIYGETVVIDHGLGVSSLYGHLSSIRVKVGDEVVEGQSIGNTGESGLAGGDHLHFSTMVHGIHVDPVEWWDPNWLADHITAKLELFPRPEPEAPEEGEDDGQEAS